MNLPQRRWKTLVKNVDKDNTTYYTLFNKRRDPNKPRSLRKFEPFQISNLLLDLDQLEVHGVRLYTEEDESSLRKKHSVHPREPAVSEKISDFRNQVDESRRRMAQLAKSPVQTWNLHPRDLLSTAIVGPPREDHLTDQTPAELRERHHDIETLRVFNGIPDHAAQHGTELLEWFTRRREQLAAHWDASPPRSKPVERSIHCYKAFREALGDATTMREVRRLVSNFFASIKSTTDFDENLAQRFLMDVQAACWSAISTNTANSEDQVLEALVFVGNLRERMLRLQLDAVLPLYLFGLRLTAMAGLVEVTSDYLSRGFQEKLWDGSPEVAEALSDTLSSYSARLQEGGSTTLDRSSEQLLLQVLTGLDEQSAITSESFRSLALAYAESQPQVFQRYIQLLSQLKADRTLCWEAQAYIRSKGTLESTAKSITALARQVEETMAKEAAEITLEECVLRDYQALGTR